jgi:2-methylcitrate dehydratase PrpD
MGADDSAVLSSTDLAFDLARFARAIEPASLPKPVQDAVRANLFDTLVCAVAGSSAPGVAEVRGLVGEWGGTPQASVLVFGERLPAHHAAWLNGTMAHARDYDDTHDAAVLHAGVSVIPAALAAAELRGGIAGSELIAAVAAGLETICRLGVATRLPVIESGFIYTGLLGHFGATVAASRALGLDEAQTVNALGIDYSMVAGNHQVTRDAALTKRMQPGFSAMSAVIAVQLARRGIRGAQATFEGIDGFFRVYLRDQVDRVKVREGLGERFELTQLSYKPYPCCRFNHTAIEAALRLREALGGRVDKIKSIRVGLNHQAYQAVCTPEAIRYSPRTVVQAQFSIPYTVAAAMIDGQVGLSHFTDRLAERGDIIAFAQKVQPRVDAQIEARYGRSISPAEVEVELADGRVLREWVELPLGHPDRPMSPADFDRKAADCFRVSAQAMDSGSLSHLRQCIDQLHQLPDATALTRFNDLSRSL